MIIQDYSFDKIGSFSSRDVDYQVNPEKFKDFIQFFPDLEGIQQATLERKKFPVNRKLLVQTIRSQYEGLTLTEKQDNNLDALIDENTFTVTCAHQPVLFTGPAYYMYKILSTIRLAQYLTETISGSKFVPVFIDGSEDHDFEEINHTTIFQKKITWEDQQKGPVGRYSIAGLKSVIDQFSDILGSREKCLEMKVFLEKIFSDSRDYKSFTLRLLHEFFSCHGLLVLNMDDDSLKKAFANIMEQEIVKRQSHNLVLETQNQLSNFGYKAQAFPREINLFYFTPEGGRERIVWEVDKYKVLNSNITWTDTEIKDELARNPGNFSPNVILRPVYQEFILPDVAFIGGGGEIAYWMERKSQFAAFGVFFPCLIRRNSVFIVNKSLQKSMDKLGMTFDSFLKDEDTIIRDFLQKVDNKQDVIDQEKNTMLESWSRLASFAVEYDQSLKAFMEAEKTRVLKIIEHVEQKLTRVLKQHEEQKISQIKNVKEKLFPSQGIQERTDNFFQFYFTEDGDVIKQLIPILNPLEKDCKVLFL